MTRFLLTWNQSIALPTPTGGVGRDIARQLIFGGLAKAATCCSSTPRVFCSTLTCLIR